MKTFAPIVVALALLAGCGSPTEQNRPPLGKIFYPTGIAVAPKPGGGNLLYVVNSNFDLEFEPGAGGTVVAIDPDASVAPPGAEIAPAKVVGAVRIPSYGGQIAVAHPGLPGCAGLTRTTAIVPVRYTNEIYALDVAADGALACGEGCRLKGDAGTKDPFGVTVVCRATATGARESAFVTHLSAKPAAGAPSGDGFVTEIDLATRASAGSIDLGAAPTADVVFDAERGLLFASPAVGNPGYAPIRWWRPAAGSASVTYSAADLNAYVSSSIARGMALSSDRTRLYVTADVYDAVLAATSGSVRITGAVLIVFDVTTTVLGQETLRPARVVPLGTGLGPIALVPRTGRRDLLVIADPSGNEVHLYDDEAESVVTSFGRDPLGRPLIREPFAIAPEALPGGAFRVWVASFRSGTLTAIDIDDPNVPGAARIGKRIGSSE